MINRLVDGVGTNKMEIEIEIVYNMYRVKPAAVSCPLVCAVGGLMLTGA
jgi:hypothetical protein